jgi:ABC-type polysaccharide transport system permease subunit
MGKGGLARAGQQSLTRSKKLARARKNYQLYLLLLLPLVWLFIFRYIPMYGVIIAFKNFNARLGILGSPWVGLKYFERYITSFYFERTVLNTITISFYQLVASFPIPIILALAMNSSFRRRFTKAVQFIIYMPHFISTVVMVGIIIEFLNPRVGIINIFLQSLGLEARDYMAIPEYFKSIYVFSGVWQHAGWGTIIYLAALSSVDPELHEAATIDGASRLQRIWHIDVPGILPTATILLILNLGRVMQVGFEKVFLMQNDLNLQASEIIATYIYKVGLASAAPSFSYGAAIGLFLSVINLILIVTVNEVAKRMGQTSLW